VPDYAAYGLTKAGINATVKIPLDKIATPEDIVGPILFLLSQNAGYITGQVLHVNGGAFMRD